MKHQISQILGASQSIEQSIKEFNWSHIHGKNGVYSLSDKQYILSLWDTISPHIQVLRANIRKSRRIWWRSRDKKTSLALLILTTRLYYRALLQFQQHLGSHEDFVRLHLDEHRRSNYSTAARFMYRGRFLLALRFPYEWLLTLSDETAQSLKPLYVHEANTPLPMSRILDHDQKNIWYYIRFRVENVVSFFAKNVGRMMAHISLKPWRKHTLITANHLENLKQSLQVGDILLTRKNWGTTNLNIPGYWKHMALYIGNGNDLKHYVAGLDIKIQEKIYDHEKYIIESIGGGVRILSMGDFFDHYDSIAVTRVVCSQERHIYAVTEALKMYHREYDYRFNYLSDRRMVCSALATKGYLPQSLDDSGLHITLEMIGLNLTYPPNSLVKKMSIEKNHPNPELSYIIGYHTHERDKTSHEITQKEFYQSYKWSKLSFFLP